MFYVHISPMSLLLAGSFRFVFFFNPLSQFWSVPLNTWTETELESAIVNYQTKPNPF